MKQRLIVLGLLLILTIGSIWPLTGSGFFPIHDDTQIARVVALGRALRSGQFPVRWVADLGYGYGYPLFNFYGPLPYYVGGFFYFLGLDGLTATKIMFALGIVLAGISMYFFAQNVVGLPGALLASLFYVYAPYHAVQIYVRGAVGEFWSLVFLPLIGLAFWLARRPNRRKEAVVIGSLGWAGVILSHTIIGYITTLFTGLGLLVFLIARILLRKDEAEWLSVFGAFCLGLGLSAFFWLPAITEMHFTSVGGQIGAGANFRDHFVCLGQLWNSLWGFGGSAPGCIDGISFKLGKLHILVALFALKKILSWPVLFGGSVVLLAIFFSLPISSSIWAIIPLAAYIQYPWRFLTFAIFGLALLGGVAGQVFKKRTSWLVAAALTVSVIYFNVKLFQPQYQYQRPTAEFETESELKFRVSRISDEYLPPQFARPKDISGLARTLVENDKDLDILNQWDKGTAAQITLKTNRTQEITIQRAYFPGWHYFVNKGEVAPQVVAGLPVLTVNEGENKVEIQFWNTPVRTLGNLVSILSLLALGSYQLSAIRLSDS